MSNLSIKGTVTVRVDEVALEQFAIENPIETLKLSVDEIAEAAAARLPEIVSLRRQLQKNNQTLAHCESIMLKDAAWNVVYRVITC